MSELTTQQRQEALGLASRALAQARADEWEATAATVRSLDGQYGAQGIEILMIGLCDTLLAAAGAHRGFAETVVPVFYDTGSRRLELADEAPPHIRWAGRFFAARAADDKATAVALVASCGSSELGRNVVALLQVVAESLNRMGVGR